MQTATTKVELVAVATPVEQGSHNWTTEGTATASGAPHLVGLSDLRPDATDDPRAYPIAQCRQATSPPPPTSPAPAVQADPAHLNEHIDRVARFLKQRRQERAAAGEVVVEDSSSIGIDLDRVDAFFVILGSRHGRIVGSVASRRMMSRCTNYIMVLLTFVPMLMFMMPILAYSDSIPAPWDFAMFMFILQPLGVGGLYWTNRLRDEMLPPRHNDGKIIRALLTGAWFFSDHILTADQSKALLAVGLAQRFSAMTFLVASAMALLTSSLPVDDELLVFLFMVLFSLPGVVWYQLIKRVHHRLLESGLNTATYHPLPVRSGAHQPESVPDLEHVLAEPISGRGAPTPSTESVVRVDAEQPERLIVYDLDMS
jgi:hypothetical protein